MSLVKFVLFLLRTELLYFIQRNIIDMKKLFVILFLFGTIISYAQSDATLQETKDFIYQKVNQNKWLDRMKSMPDGWSFQIVRVEFPSDSITIHKTLFPSANNDVWDGTIETFLSMKISDISVDIRKKIIANENVGTLIFTPVYQKKFVSDDSFWWAINGEIELRFELDNESEIDRLLKALKHLIVLSGGKTEKF